MLKTISLLLVWIPAIAQPRITITGPSTILPGRTVSLVLGIDQTGTFGAVAAQWTLPVGVVWDQSPSQASGKSFASSGSTYLLFGAVPGPVSGVLVPGTVFNRTPLIDGPIQGLSYTAPANAVAGSTITIAAVAPFGVTDTGAVLTFGSVPVTIKVASTFDLNSDGTVDAADAQIALTQWIATKSSADLVLLIKVIALIL